MMRWRCGCWWIWFSWMGKDWFSAFHASQIWITKRDALTASQLGYLIRPTLQTLSIRPCGRGCPYGHKSAVVSGVSCETYQISSWTAAILREIGFSCICLRQTLIPVPSPRGRRVAGGRSVRRSKCLICGFWLAGCGFAGGKPAGGGRK